MLTIGFDASSTLAPRTGVGRAALGLIRALAALEDNNAEFRVLLNSLTRRAGPEHEPLAEAPNVKLVRARRPGGMTVRAWARGKGPAADALLGPGLDLYHAASSYMPPVLAAKRVISVYDLAFLEDAPAEREPLGGGMFAATFPKLLPACDLVVTSSEFSRARIIETYRLPVDRVAVIPLSIDPEVFRIESERFVEIARHDLGIPSQDYLLGVSDHHPRKRPSLLLDIYEQLREREPATPPLVVLGWAGRPHEALRSRPHLYRHVHVLGRVHDRLLAGLYTGAVATIVASRHEGFGFPILEAQACGSPVVCGRNSSLPEVGGNGAVYVETDLLDDWIETVRSVAYHQDARDLWRERGLANINRFSWEKTARAMIEHYQRVCG